MLLARLGMGKGERAKGQTQVLEAEPSLPSSLDAVFQQELDRCAVYSYHYILLVFLLYHNCNYVLYYVIVHQIFHYILFYSTVSYYIL